MRRGAIRNCCADCLYSLWIILAERLLPRSIDTLKHLSTLGKTVILSDGDVTFQPRKILRSGLWDAVEGRVLIYVHKEQMLADVARRYPARHYIMVDDKLCILTSMKKIWENRLTTVFPHRATMHATLQPWLPMHRLTSPLSTSATCLITI